MRALILFQRYPTFRAFTGSRNPVNIIQNVSQTVWFKRNNLRSAGGLLMESSFHVFKGHRTNLALCLGNYVGSIQLLIRWRPHCNF